MKLFETLIVATAATLLPSIALACGGVFCGTATAPGGPQPVDQTAERILFDMDVENEVTEATVEIRYEGDPLKFAWIIPVPGVPEIADGDVEELDELTAMTNPSFTMPPIVENCSPTPTFNGGGDSGGGCVGCGSDDESFSRGANFATGGPANNTTEEPKPSVFPAASGSTGTYDYVILEATDASELTTWLRDNEFNVTDNMIPAIQPYLDEGKNFLAVRFDADVDVDAIPPIKMTYEGAKTTIPIRLTAIAAKPHMSVLVFLRSTVGYRPENWPEYEIAPEEILHDADGRTNYFDLTARIADEQGGHVWFKEAALRMPDDKMAGEFATISRYYARINPEQMTEDPEFGPDNTGFVAKSSLLNLPQDRSLYCNEFGTAVIVPERQPSPCAFAYCGAGTCVEQNGEATCACPGDMVVQRFESPAGPRVTCTPRDNPLGVTPESAGAGTAADACSRTNCGLGICVLKGGFATCQCETDAVARVAGSVTTCVLMDDDAVARGSGADMESLGEFEALLEGTTPSAPAGAILIFALGFLGLRRVTRSRRR